ncbi:MAG: hypothetical protein QXO54_02830 [Candidatus Methanomethylicaceae archaeon]
MAPLISIVLIIVISITGSTVTYVFINDFIGDHDELFNFTNNTRGV